MPQDMLLQESGPLHFTIGSIACFIIARSVTLFIRFIDACHVTEKPQKGKLDLLEDVGKLGVPALPPTLETPPINGDVFCYPCG